ncbi:type VI secretion system baseplate subunit TssG [Paraburkholderia sp. HP33-1]|uniref:type VI secretion system baseplate subunit TssG n=1 Tax=Paraburkholderia sp. HP33-1 TaxID=2883243 RepID=UPI001F325EA0|nr:type VI secretion system baseplate subunit TssG [Paraburkholderia sp. HP33-1]
MEAMGADDRLPAVALIARLLPRPHGFDLFQAIHLLECAQPWATGLGRGDGANEAVRLRGFVSLAFQASDIHAVDRHASSDEHAARETYTVSTPVMTLAGIGGPLPLAFTEMLLERRAAREPAMADLLDIFNHRFLSFFYRSRQKHALGLAARAPGEAPLATSLDALGSLGLHDGKRGPDDARLWLRHAGLFANGSRSMTGLLALLSDRLGVRVRGTQFVGGWRDVDARDSLRLGRSQAGQCALRTGGLAVLGRRSWDQAAGVRIEFLDVPAEQFAALLPGGEMHRLAAWLVRCHLQQDFDVEFVLYPAARRERCAVGAPGLRLGWTSWLAASADEGGAPSSKPAPVRFAMRAGEARVTRAALRPS